MFFDKRRIIENNLTRGIPVRRFYHQQRDQTSQRMCPASDTELSDGEAKALHCHYSKVLLGPELYYLLGPHQQAK